jgi:hypothetical protein
MEPGRVPSAAAMNAFKTKTVLRRVLEGEELAQVAERSQRNMGFQVSPIDLYPRCLLDVPFSHGLIALTARDPEDLTGADEKVLQQMAQAISLTSCPIWSLARPTSHMPTASSIDMPDRVA